MRTSRWRRCAMTVVALVAALGLSGCDRGMLEGGGSGSAPTVLIVSDAWVASQRGGSSEDTVQQRIGALTKAINELREETGTGWIGRQDDVTGYLADLSGGSWQGGPAEFVDSYGPTFFGIGSAVLRFQSPDNQTVPGMVSTRATQAVGDVKVLDASLVFSSRGGSVQDMDRLSGVRGRVFPGLQVSTTPVIGRREAARIAARASNGTVQGRTELAVVPTGAGILTWEVNIVGGSQASTLGSGLYYVDASTGEIVTTRATSAQSAPPARLFQGAQSGPAAAPDPNDVEVSGVDPHGKPITARGRRTDGGVELVDTTTPAWQQQSGKGGIYTYNAAGVSDAAMPGKLVVSPDSTIRDPDALAAQATAHEVIAYYESLGRSSWDGEGGSLISAVHYGPSTECNAYFNWGSKPMMIFGDPCSIPGAKTASFVDIDATAHEITHGVTSRTAGLVYSGQSGALNESFSDYFGNVIGNLVTGTDSVAFAEGVCEGITEPSAFCETNPDGTTSMRYMLNGNGYDQYLRLLDVGFRLDNLGFNQDQGGVHINSAIWNNALWSVRTQLAKIDGLSANESPLAQSFDRAVYGALATRLGPTSDFIDARAGVEQVIIDSSLDPVVLRVAREVFDANKFCAECLNDSPSVGSAVAAAPQTELHPGIAGDRVAWVDRSHAASAGQVATTTIGGSGATHGSSIDVLEVGFAGEAIVTLDDFGTITRIDESGAEQVLARTDAARTLFGGFVGSDAGAAWVGSNEELSFVDPTGKVVTTALPGLAGGTVAGVGTGGGFVAAGTDDGKVFLWKPGDAPTQVGQMSGAVLTLAAYDGSVLAIDDGNHAQLFTSDGRTLAVSNAATPYGAAMNGEYAVWTEMTGNLETGVLPGGGYPETDLYLVSLSSGNIYNQVDTPGQQGFPALSGRQLVWQDASLGGNDIFTAQLPSGM